MKIQYKKWFVGTFVGLIAAILGVALVVVIVDPYFHYHAPISGISYQLNNERYMNNGIVKNFEYEAIVTGSSMNQNFKTTSVETIFGLEAVKTTFSGSGFEEVCSNLSYAFASENDVKMVIWGIDYNGLRRDFNWAGYENYPTYLYDYNLWNDSSYLWNKAVLFHGVLNNLTLTLMGQESTTFDEYSAWEKETGLDAISNTYIRIDEIAANQDSLTPEEEKMVYDNINENLVKMANENPDVELYLFYTPYSVLYWESLYREGELVKQIEAEKIATQLLLECDNIRLYNFSEQTQITADLHYYRDKEHYSSEINEQILQWMADGVGLVTKENYEERLDWELDWYMNFDYDSIYALWE